MRESVEIIHKHLMDPSIQWQATEHVLKNLKYGYELWIGNELKFIRIYAPTSLYFTEAEQNVLRPLIIQAIEEGFLNLIKSQTITGGNIDE